MQSVHADKFAVARTFMTGSWLGREYQGQGVGKQMRAAVLTFMFEHIGAEFATTDARTENAASLGVTRAMGYAENGRRYTVVRDERVLLHQFLMSRALWEKSAAAHVDLGVEGLGPCKAFFGIK